MANPVANNISGVLAAATASITSSTAGDLTTQLEQLTTQLQQLQTVNQAALESTRGNTQAVEATTPRSSASESTGRSIGGTLLSVFGSGLGLSPLISGIASLFGGREESSEPPPLVRFALPPSQRVSAGISGAVDGPAFGVDYAQGGLPRPVTASAPQITVQVQAMDSRSFLDHSHDIALAVRQAMLESSVLNDVVREA